MCRLLCGRRRAPQPHRRYVMVGRLPNSATAIGAASLGSASFYAFAISTFPNLVFDANLGVIFKANSRRLPFEVCVEKAAYAVSGNRKLTTAVNAELAEYAEQAAKDPALQERAVVGKGEMVCTFYGYAQPPVGRETFIDRLDVRLDLAHLLVGGKIALSAQKEKERLVNPGFNNGAQGSAVDIDSRLATWIRRAELSGLGTAESVAKQPRRTLRPKTTPTND